MARLPDSGEVRAEPELAAPAREALPKLVDDCSRAVESRPSVLAGRPVTDPLGSTIVIEREGAKHPVYCLSDGEVLPEVTKFVAAVLDALWGACCSSERWDRSALYCSTWSLRR